MAAAPCLLHLPAEIRLAIYQFLLSNHDDKTLSIRTEDPTLYEQRKHQQRLRTTYHHISDRLRGRSIRSSYYLWENPGIYPSILGVNRQTHAEAGHVLYSQHILDFGMDIESAVPFLQDLTPTSRESVKRIRIVKRAIPYSKSFDNCEWQTACTYISENLQLTQLDLGVFGGVPGSIWGSPLGQQEPKEMPMSDFHVITMFETMEWARQLAAIKGLQMLNVKAIMEHCPPPKSSAMAFFVNFSASIEKGFKEYMNSVMVT